MSYNPLQPKTVFHTAVASSVTGTVVVTTLATFNLKGTVMGPRDLLMIDTIYSVTNSANTKTLSITVGGTTVFGLNVTTIAANGRIVYFLNRDSTIVQFANATGTNGTYGNVGNSAFAIDTSVTQSILFRGTLTNAGETITLERATVRVLRIL